MSARTQAEWAGNGTVLRSLPGNTDGDQIDNRKYSLDLIYSGLGAGRRKQLGQERRPKKEKQV